MIEEKKPLEKYISLQEAAKFCSYSQEYLSLRARQGKLKSAKLGRNWVTTKEWLGEYLKHNGNGYQVAIEVKESRPPENLPFAPDNFSPEIFQPPRNIFDAFKRLNLKPRPSFIFALVFTLIVASSVFSKENFSGVYNDVSQIAKNISEKIADKDFVILGNIVSIGEISKSSSGAFSDYNSWMQAKINNNSTLYVFGDYGSWVKQKSGPIVSPLVKSYQAADKFSEKKFSLVFWKTVKTANFIEKKTNQTVTAINEGYSSAVRAPKLFADFLARISKLAMSPWRDFAELKSELKSELSELSKLKEMPFLVKRVEVERVVEPVKEITREIETIQQITKVDDAALADLKVTLSYLEGEIGKRLYAPGGVISQTIRVTEPVQSPKIYQENGEIVLQTLGSGNVILSAATGLQMYGSQVVIESTSKLNPMIYLASKSRIGGSLAVDGSITGGALSASSIGASGAATVGGNLTVGGDITVSGTQTFSGVTAISASSTSAVLTVTQTGSGDVVNFKDDTTEVFTIIDGGNVGIATSTPSAALSVGGDIMGSGNVTFYSTTATTTIAGGLVVDAQTLVVDPYSGRIGIGTTTLAGLLTVGTTTPAFVVDPRGNVGVATTVPSMAFSVQGQCVTGDTRLRRRRKRYNDNDYDYDEVMIKDIQPGDEIASLDEKTGKIVWSKVNALLDMGVKEIYKLTTEDGRTIRTTINHPYLTKNGWTKVSNIKIGDEIAAPQSKPKVGVFIDNANLFYAQRRSGWKIDFAKIKGLLNKSLSVEFFNYYAAMPAPWDDVYKETANYLDKIKEIVSLKLKPLKYIFADKKLIDKKGDVDLEIALDVARNIDKLDIAVVMSGDSDYLELKNYVLEKGKKIIFLGLDRTMAWELRKIKHLLLDSIRQQIELGVENKTTPEFDLGRQLLDLVYRQDETLSRASVVDKEKEILWAKVASIEKVGEEQVYDIEVEGTHNFVAGHYINRKTGKALTIEQEEEYYQWKNSKREARNSKQYQNSNDQNSKQNGFEHLDLENLNLFRISNFGFRISEDDIVFGGIIAHNTYMSATTTIKDGLVVGGSDLYVSENGRVGIGTTTPASKLDVAGTLTLGASTAIVRNIKSDILGISGGTAWNDGAYMELEGEDFVDGPGRFILYTPNAAKSTVLARFAITGAVDTAAAYFENSNIGIGGDDTPDFRLETAGTSTKGYFGISSTINADGDILTVNTSGNVGIGTTTPRYALDVWGDISFGTSTGVTGPQNYPMLYVNTGEGGTSNGVGIGTTTVSGTMLTVGTTTPAFIVSQTGNVGIASSTPSDKFAVQGNIIGSGNLILYGSAASKFQGGFISNSSSTFAATTTINTGGLVVDGNRLYVSENGRVGIGTITPDYKLTVSGAASISGGIVSTASSTFGNVTLQDLAVNYGVSAATSTVTASSTLGSINADSGLLYVDAYVDRVGVASTTPSDKFSVQGNIIASGDILFYGAAATTTIKGGLLVGANTLYVPAGGKVGIGTTTPRYLLDVWGDMAIGTSTDTNTPAFYVDSGNGGRIGIGTTTLTGLLTVGTSTPSLVVDPAGKTGIASSTPSDQFAVQGNIIGSGNLILYGSAASKFQGGFISNSSSTFAATTTINTGGFVVDGNRLYISENGNIGIGTTGPLYRLDVNGKLRSNRYILGTGPDLSLIPVVDGQSVLSSWWGLQLIGNRQADVDYTPSNYGSADDFSVIIPNQQASKIGLVIRGAASQTGNLMQWQNSGGTALGGIDSTGNVGIGTTTPRYKLDVWGDLAIGTSTDTNTPALYVDSGNGGRIGIGTTTLAGLLTVGTSTPSLVVDPAGKTGIASSTPSDQFAVQGNIIGSGNLIIYGSAASKFQGGFISNSSSTFAATTTINTGGFVVDGNRLYVSENGRVGIGTITPDYKLTVSGSASISGGIISTASSTFGNVTMQDLLLNYGISAATSTVTASSTLASINADSGLFYADAYANKVGISTTTPRYLLDVWGDIGFGTSTVTGTGQMPALYIDSGDGGRVGIGTTTLAGLLTVGTSTQALVVGANGNVTMAGNLALDGAMYQDIYGSDDGLVLYLPFSEGMTSSSASTAYDRSPFGNDGTATNMPMPARNATSGESGWATTTSKCKVGSCMSFDGVNDYVDAGTAVGQGLSAYTMEIWIKQNIEHTNDVWVLSKNSVFGLELQGTASGADYSKKIYLIKWDGAGAYLGGLSATTLLEPGNWYHIVGTSDGTTAKIYVNGVLENSVALAGVNSNANVVKIGAGSTYLNGLIDEVRIYNRALTADEIRAHYLRGTGAGGAVLADKFRVIGTDNNIDFIVNAGDVGIGTSTPSTKLAVAGNIMGSGNIVIYGSATSTYAGGIQATAVKLTQNPTVNYVLTSDASGFGSWQSLAALQPNTWQFIGPNAIRPTTTIGIIVNASSTFAATTTINTGGFVVDGNRMYVSENGRVGIGTITPDYKLTVSGAASITGGIVSTASSTLGNVTLQDLAVNYGVSAATSTVTASSTLGSINADSGLLYVDAYVDRVGVASTTPSDKFSVQGNIISSGDILFYGTAATTTIKGGLLVGANTLYVPSGGRVGIGTTTPRYKLDVWGDIGFGTSTSAGAGPNTPALYVDSGDGGRIGIGTTTLTGLLTVGTSTPSLVVDPAGKTGIASSTPSDQFAVQGNIIGSGNLVIYGSATSTYAGGIQATAVKLTQNPTVNYVLTSDANGFGAWQSLATLQPNTWQFIGPNAIRPTTTIGIIVNASSTFAGDLTVNSAQYPLGASLFIDASEGRVGIGTTTLAGLFTVGTSTPSLVVAANGNVGIGTTTPENVLTINSAASRALTVTAEGNLGIGMATTSTRLTMASGGRRGDFAIGDFNAEIIDDMEAVGDWTSWASSTVLTAAETSIVKVGSGSLKVYASSTPEDMVAVKTYASNQDWSAFERLGFWVRTSKIATSTATTTQTLSVGIHGNTDNVTSTHQITFQSENKWQYEEWNIDTVQGVTTTDRIFFRIDFNNLGTINFYIDQLRLYDDTERTGEIFVDADGVLAVLGRGGVEIGRADGSSNKPGLKVDAAVVEINQPLSVDVGGDVGMGNDLQFLSAGLSQITSEGPLRIAGGDPNHGENLTLTVGGTGDIIVELANASSTFMVTQGVNASTTAFIINSETTATSTAGYLGAIFQIITDVSSDENVVFSVDAGGSIRYDMSAISPASDVAENYRVIDESIEAGDVVCLASSGGLVVEKCSKDYQTNLLGAISSRPSLLMAGDLENARMVALAGRVPVKVSAENGPINIGDPLTSASSTPGVAMKATRAGKIFGYALEPFGFEKSEILNPKSETNSNDQNSNSTNTDSLEFSASNLEFPQQGAILAFIHLDELGGDLTVSQNEAGHLVVSAYTANGQTQFFSLDETGALVVNKIKTQELCVGSVCVTEADFMRVFGASLTGGTATGTATTTDPVITTALFEVPLQTSVFEVELQTALPNGANRPCSSQVGACQIGVQIYTDGVWGECMGAIFPTEEIMDEVDNDCDGTVDEGLVGEATESPAGGSTSTSSADSEHSDEFVDSDYISTQSSTTDAVVSEPLTEPIATSTTP